MASVTTTKVAEPRVEPVPWRQRADGGPATGARPAPSSPIQQRLSSKLALPCPALPCQRLPTLRWPRHQPLASNSRENVHPLIRSTCPFSSWPPARAQTEKSASPAPPRVSTTSSLCTRPSPTAGHLHCTPASPRPSGGQPSCSAWNCESRSSGSSAPAADGAELLPHFHRIPHPRPPSPPPPPQARAPGTGRGSPPTAQHCWPPPARWCSAPAPRPCTQRRKQQQSQGRQQHQQRRWQKQHPGRSQS